MKNPFLENFRPYIPDAAKLRELTPLPLIVGTVLGIIFRGVVALSCVKGRSDGFGLDTRRGDRDHPFPLTFKTGSQGRDDPRGQRHADGGLGRRIDSVRSRRDDAGDHDPRLRSGHHASDAGCRARRTARYFDDDPAQARTDQGSARISEISRGHRLRRGVKGRCVEGITRGFARRRYLGRRRFGIAGRQDHLYRLCGRICI